jgi:hypothetical protein
LLPQLESMATGAKKVTKNVHITNVKDFKLFIFNNLG